jgi:hypothetical protein
LSGVPGERGTGTDGTSAQRRPQQPFFRVRIKSQKETVGATAQLLAAVGVDRVLDGDPIRFIRSYLMAKKTKGKPTVEPDEDAA